MKCLSDILYILHWISQFYSIHTVVYGMQIHENSMLGSIEFSTLFSVFHSSSVVELQIHRLNSLTGILWLFLQHNIPTVSEIKCYRTVFSATQVLLDDAWLFLIYISSISHQPSHQTHRYLVRLIFVGPLLFIALT